MTLAERLEALVLEHGVYPYHLFVPDGFECDARLFPRCHGLYVNWLLEDHVQVVETMAPWREFWIPIHTGIDAMRRAVDR